MNPAQVRCTWYNIMWSNLPVTCDRSVVFYTNKTDHHDLAEILLNTINLNQTKPNHLSLVQVLNLEILVLQDLDWCFEDVFNIGELKNIELSLIKYFVFRNIISMKIYWIFLKGSLYFDLFCDVIFHSTSKFWDYIVWLCCYHWFLSVDTMFFPPQILFDIIQVLVFPPLS